VVTFAEINDARSARDGARNPDRAGHRLRTGIAKRGAFHAGQFAKQSGHFSGERGGRTDLHPARELRRNRFEHKRRLMAQHRGAEAQRDVGPFVAVDVPKFRALRALDHDRINNFFPLLLEPGHRARIGQVAAVLLGVPLRSSGAGVVSSDEVVEPALLTLG
jgi:hypothetical protein